MSANNDPSVVFKAQVGVPSTSQPYLNAALLTFVPSTSAFDTGFTTNAPLRDADLGLTGGVAAVLTPNNWQSRLRAWGATSTEPVWINVEAHFSAQGAADAQGIRAGVTRPPYVVIGRRPNAVQSQQTFEITTATAGRVTFTFLPTRNNFTAGYLAQYVLVADGVLTATQLRDNAVAALNLIPAFVARYVAAPVGADEFTVTSIADGFPLIVTVSTTTGGPVIVQTITTANIAGDYYDDLDYIRQICELQDDPTLGVPIRRFYWITDLQLDDTVGAEGLEWVQDQNDAIPALRYQFLAPSASPLNFDPLAVASPAQLAQAANGGIGWEYGGIFDHDLYEFQVSALLGRTIGYLPGEISFTDKQLQGSTASARITPRARFDNAILATDRSFNYYSAEGVGGTARWGYTASGGRLDRNWLAAYAEYVATLALQQWKQLKNITTYTNADISAGAGVIKASLLTLPALSAIADSLVVNFVPREEVNPANVGARTYLDYEVFGLSGGVMERIGTISDPTPINIIEG